MHEKTESERMHEATVALIVTKSGYPADFIELCLQNGLSPYNQEYGSTTVMAYFWYCAGKAAK